MLASAKVPLLPAMLTTKMNEQKYLYYLWSIVAAMLLGNFLPRLPAVGSYIKRCSFYPVPLFWLAVALAIFLWIPQIHVPGPLRLRKQLSGAAFSGAVIFLAVNFSTGLLLQKMASSPYDLSPQGIIINYIGIFPALAAREGARAYAVGIASRRLTHLRFWITLIVLAACLFEINFFKVLLFKSSKEWFIYAAKDVLPLIAESSLLTALAFCGGPWASIIYSGSIKAFMRTFPFLPSLPWIAESALGTIFPIIMALFIWNWYNVLNHKQSKRQRESIGLFTAGLVFSVAFAWFAVGVFPIYPSVILTGSMEPEIFPGDIVLIQKFSEEQEVYSLSENDVINFKRENITITHRIIAVLYDQEGNISFQTKGDNNKVADDIIVMANDLNGIIKKVVPKIGLPVLWMQSREPIPEGVLDY